MPTTPEGKAISSKNSLRHGCCSPALIIPGESEEQLNEIRDGWLAEYYPQSEPALTLVLETVKKYWFLLRAERWYNRTLQELPQEPIHWSEEQHKSVDRFTRYRTAAERGFHRAFNDLQNFYKLRRTSGPRTIERSAPVANDRPSSSAAPSIPPPPAKGSFFSGKDAPQKQRKIQTLEQWIEVTVEDGKTVTRLYPTNEELIREGHQMLPPPDLIYRRINFVDGVPPEYDWATSSPERRQNGGAAIQRMSVNTWLETIAKETEDGTGHIGPCGKPLPRPPERGACECPTCTRLYAT